MLKSLKEYSVKPTTKRSIEFLLTALHRHSQEYERQSRLLGYFYRYDASPQLLSRSEIARSAASKMLFHLREIYQLKLEIESIRREVTR